MIDQYLNNKFNMCRHRPLRVMVTISENEIKALKI